MIVAVGERARFGHLVYDRTTINGEDFWAFRDPQTRTYWRHMLGGARVDREINLLPPMRRAGEPWDMQAARIHAARLLAVLDRGDRLVLLGRRVQNAFHIRPEKGQAIPFGTIMAGNPWDDDKLIGVLLMPIPGPRRTTWQERVRVVGALRKFCTEV